MKSIKILSLFFLFYVNEFQLAAQESSQDSIAYYYELASELKNDEDYAKSYNYFEKQLDFYRANGDALSEVSMLINLAQIQIKTGFFTESENSAVEALKLLDSLKFNENQNAYRESIYNHLGILYYEIQDYKKSIEYYDKVIELTNNPQSRIIVLNNMGNVYKEQKLNEIALEYYKKSFDSSLKYRDVKVTARALDNLGSIKSRMLLPEALKNLTDALKIREDESYPSGIITSYLHLGEYYKDRGNRERALFYANKALEISDSINNIEFKKGALTFFNTLSEDIRVLELVELNDSLSNVEKSQNNRNANQRYNLGLIKEEINKKELELEQQKSEKQLYLLLALLILSSSIFLYFILKSKHKKDKIKEAYLKETELSKKVHDELANDMSDLMNFVENDIEVINTKKSLLLDNIEDIYLRTRDISTETGSIDLINFSESIKHLLMQHNRQDTKVVINDINTITWQNVADHKRTIVYRCLQELMVNMKKHSKAKVVSIVFKEHNNKKEIRYVDDGIGFVNEGVKLNGLQNVESRIKGIGGSFNFTTSKGNGFKAILEFNS